MRRIKKFEQALIEGQWFEYVKGAKVFADIAIGVGLVAAAGAAAYGTYTQGQIAGDANSLAANQAGKQNQAFQQLQQLIQDPGSFFNSPVYKASADQGAQAVAKTNAAAFGPNSMNEATALQSFGQQFGQQQLLGQEQLLAGMSGTGFNPAGALGTASGAAQSAAGNLASIGGLMSFFGNSGSGSFIPSADSTVGGA